MTNLNITESLIDPEYLNEFTKLYEQEGVMWGDR